MKLELKPFDFQQAVARAGLRPDGTPLSDHRPSTVTFDWSLTPG